MLVERIQVRLLGDLSPIDAPIMTLSGSTDPFLNEQDAVGWALYTNGGHVHAAVDGDHFFLISRASEVVPAVEQALQRILDGTSAPR
jgi:surfactin synthase thioesterase subunit